MLEFWKSELRRAPIVLVPLGALAVTLVMNARTGYRLGEQSLEVAAVLIAIGLGGAYAGATFYRMRGARRWGLVLVLVVGIVVDQLSAWQTLGLRFADGGIARQTKATGLETVNERLAARRAERAAIKVQRSLGAIAAELDLELRRTSKAYPNGDGPAAMKLKAEKANAEQAERLDKEIAGLIEALEGREQVAGGAPQFQVAIGLAQRAADYLYGKGATKVVAEHITFFLLMVLAGALGLLANLGFWLFGVGHEGARAREYDEDLADVLGISRVRALPPPRASSHAVSDGYASGAGVDPARGGSATANGAPINIYVGGERGGSDGGVAGPEILPPQAPAAAPVFERRALDAVPDDVPPADRSRVRRVMAPEEREAADLLLKFRAACVVDAPGATVPARQLYARYREWAGERALDERAFLALLPDAASVEIAHIGGVPHARGIVMRIGSRLSAVA